MHTVRAMLLVWRLRSISRCLTPPVRGNSGAIGQQTEVDGWRSIVSVDPSLPSGIEVRSRTGRFLTKQVPELHHLADVVFRMVLGELVAASDDGNVDLYRLGERMLTKYAKRSVTFCAFDVLWLDGIDCTAH